MFCFLPTENRDHKSPRARRHCKQPFTRKLAFPEPCPGYLPNVQPDKLDFNDLLGSPQQFFRSSGARLDPTTHPRLAPWAAFFRRFAADFAYSQTFKGRHTARSSLTLSLLPPRNLQTLS